MIDEDIINTKGKVRYKMNILKIKEGQKVKRPNWKEGHFWKRKDGKILDSEGTEISDFEVIEETLSEKGVTYKELVDFLLEFAESQVKQALDGMGFNMDNINVNLDKDMVKAMNNIINKEYKNHIIVDSDDIKGTFNDIEKDVRKLIHPIMSNEVIEIINKRLGKKLI